MSTFLSHHRLGAALLGLIAGLLLISPGLVAAFILDRSLWRPRVGSFLLLSCLIMGGYVILTALSLLAAGLRGLTSCAYYGGWTAVGILLASLVSLFEIKISQTILIAAIVVPMIGLQYLKDHWRDRLSDVDKPVSDAEQALIDQVRIRVDQVLADNRWINQKIRQGIVGQMENRGQRLFMINYNLYSPRRVIHHGFTRCFRIELPVVLQGGHLKPDLARHLNHLISRISKRNKACFAGAILDEVKQIGIFLIYYHPRFALALYRQLTVWKQFMPGQPDIVSEQDAVWSRYFDDLAPDPCVFQHLINLYFYAYLEKRRFDFTQEACLWFLLAFQEKDQMELALEGLLCEQYALEIKPEEQSSPYNLIVKKETRLGMERLNILTDQLLAVITPLGGWLITYDQERDFKRHYRLDS